MSAPLLPVMRPLLPAADRLLPYLRRIDDARTYSNLGPLLVETRARMAEHFGVTDDRVAVVANGTLGLQALIETVGSVGDEWSVPSWTFVASAQALVSARRRVHFVDVDPEDWAMRPGEAPRSVGHLVVAPFGARPQVGRWRGIPGPQVFDAASCFDACAGIGPSLGDRQALMVSLHTTKTLPAGEGAVIVADPAWIADAARWANFGFRGTREAVGPGLNAKMSEYHAAVALASLDEWATSREEWSRSTDRARAVAGDLGLVPQPAAGEGSVTTTWNVLLDPAVDIETVRADLLVEGIETRRWWSGGVATMRAFSEASAEPLPVTDRLAGRALGLPLHRDMGAEAFDRIGGALQRSLRRALR